MAILGACQLARVRYTYCSPTGDTDKISCTPPDRVILVNSKLIYRQEAVVVNRKTEIPARLSQAFDVVFPGATMQDIARYYGIHVNTLSNYLSGASRPSVDFLAKLGVVTTRKTARRVDLHWLLTGEGSMLIDAQTHTTSRAYKVLRTLPDPAIWSELQRRQLEAIEEGLELLRRVQDMNLDDLAAKATRGNAYGELSEAERDQVDIVWKAFWCFFRATSWPHVVDPRFYPPYHEFFKLDAATRNDPNVIAIMTRCNVAGWRDHVTGARVRIPREEP